MTYIFKPGSLVTLRNRPWIVLPSDDEDILLVKPLGGSEQEVTGIFKPLANPNDLPVSYDFKKPNADDIGDFASAKLLYNASRLSFRNAAGPFRCLAKISFRPRSYQMVPLIMALKNDPVRLLIADDVGVGKTIEALLIAKEMFDRQEIKGFSVVCLPHLCDQWQDELKSKFGIDAVIIRSGTVASLERQIRINDNIFRAYPFQIISIDYIKIGEKRQKFIDHCPNLIIVDEAHTCAKPAGANNSQQLRYALLHDLLSQRKNINLLMLTATPHSGKQAEFQSLLGLLNPEFETIDLTTADEEGRKKVAKHFIQRRRGDVLKWLDEETHFPTRLPEDPSNPYNVSVDYANIFNDILAYARDIIKDSGTDHRKQRYNYWDALALLRGVMSSPASGVSMLQKKALKKKLDTDDDDQSSDQSAEANVVLDTDSSHDDNLPMSVVGKSQVTTESESKRLLAYAKRLDALAGIEYDNKAKEAIAIIKGWLKQGLSPILFCRYIPTANYLGKLCKEYFTGKAYSKLHIEIITSELNDELRREKIKLMEDSSQRLLIATDCLSEGINLQEGFNALIHYDLPWNPNRLEQREGRIDRFGQQANEVWVARLFGSNNPVDGVVLDVLYKKSDEIRKSIGIRVPLPEDSTTVMNAVMQAVLMRNAQIKQTPEQLSLFEEEEITASKENVQKLLQKSADREKVSRSIFAQHSIKASELENDLKEIDEAIGDTKVVESFVLQCLSFIGIQANKFGEGYKIFTTNIPERIRTLLTDKPDILVSFKSPTPAGYKYIGRNHPFVEQLCQTIINNSLHNTGVRAARAAVVPTSAVHIKTVIFQFRVRNVIAEQTSNRQFVAEEMWLWGYRGKISDNNFVLFDEAKELLMNAPVTHNIETPEQQYWLNDELSWVTNETEFRSITDPVAWIRANKLVDSHSRVRKLLKTGNYKPVEPILPMDVLGIYILLPSIN